MTFLAGIFQQRKGIAAGLIWLILLCFLYFIRTRVMKTSVFFLAGAQQKAVTKIGFETKWQNQAIYQD